LLISGASITACHRTSYHMVALEENKDIFDTFFKPMMRLTLAVVEIQLLLALQDPNEMPVMVWHFTWKGKFNK